VSATSGIPSIGTLREGPLHASIKERLARPGDRLEVQFERFVIDLVRADGELVEVQTGSFAALGKKLDVLLDTHRMRIVHPIAAERRIVRVDEHGEVLSSRRAPRRPGAIEVFDELVAFPSMLTHPNLTLELLLLSEDHIRRPEPVRKRRRTRDPGERRLLAVLGGVELRAPEDLRDLVEPLPEAPFTTRELASAKRCGLVLAQRIVYCLKANGLIEPAGHRARAPLYKRCPG
jgi:hypothetical protein